MNESNSVSYTLEHDVQCPTLVNSSNWSSNEGYIDTFSVVQTGKNIVVTRTDFASGWGMNLSFECCTGKIFIRLFIARK